MAVMPLTQKSSRRDGQAGDPTQRSERGKSFPMSRKIKNWRRGDERVGKKTRAVFKYFMGNKISLIL